MFSSRVPQDLTPNALARAIAALRASGRRLVDLTASNPTVAGIEYPEHVLAPLSSAKSRTYRPEPFGAFDAREAVSRDYARRGTGVAADRIVLTSGTSEAYSLLFKLLCEPGDCVLVPAPSYPLFDHLAQLEAVRTATYRLEYHGGWTVDHQTVEDSWTDDTRAVLAVSPNNPTGSLLSPSDECALSVRCRERDAALIVDEVFIDYPLPRRGRPPREADPGRRTPDPPLTFRLGGLSKSAGLPQVKLGWIAAAGESTMVAGALQRLEIICDTYLSVSTPVQIAAPELIEAGAAVRTAVLARVGRNYAALEDAVAGRPAVELLHADGGWSAVLRVPATRSEEQLVLELAEQDGVLVHPGYFFDFPHEAFLVISLLPAPAEFDDGVRRVLSRCDG